MFSNFAILNLSIPLRINIESVPSWREPDDWCFQFHWGLTWSILLLATALSINFQFHWGLTMSQAQNNQNQNLDLLSIPLRINLLGAGRRSVLSVINFQFHWGLTYLKHRIARRTRCILYFQFHWGLTGKSWGKLNAMIMNFQFHWGLT